VAASLVCQLAGLPERGVDKTRDEKVSFVLRRFDGVEEYAWVPDPGAPGGKTWIQVPSAQRAALVAGEEVVPMFPVLYQEGGRSRRIHAGLIPTSNRETYQSTAPPPPVSVAGDPRAAQFDTRVLAALSAITTPPTTPPVFGSAPGEVPVDTGTLRTASAFLLLDFADLLATHLPKVWAAILGTGPAPSGTDPASGLFLALTTKIAGGSTRWSTALSSAWQVKDLVTAGNADTPSAVPDLSGSTLDADTLRSLVTTALGPVPTASSSSSSASSASSTSATLSVPKLDVAPTTLYRIRCVFSRPRCGALITDQLSDPTDPFSIAQFFDSDAPQRKIRIPMPIDPSIAGLRKFTPSVGFILSKQLRAQIGRVADLKKILDGNVASSTEPSIGEICSFSIPVITICALIVLMIFISLLNIVFFWMPFLKICLPIPESQPSNSSSGS